MRAQQDVEAGPLVPGREGEEDERVLTDVGVYVHEHGTADRAELAERGRRHRDEVADASHLDQRLTLR